MKKPDELSVLFIRHALSKYNLWENFTLGKVSKEDQERYQDEIADVKRITGKRDFALADSRLCKKGLEQAARACYDAYPIKYVFVSPLRRTLETCRLLFASHPNKPKFIVQPLIREILNLPNDVPSPLKELKADYPDFDFSLVDAYPQPELHFIYTLNSPARENILEMVKAEPKVPYMQIMENYKLQICHTQPKHKHRVEAYENVQQRIGTFAEFVRDFVKKTGCNPKEIAVVTHCVFIGYIQAKKFNSYGKADFEPIDNCASVYVDISKLLPGKA